MMPSSTPVKWDGDSSTMIAEEGFVWIENTLGQVLTREAITGYVTIGDGFHIAEDGTIERNDELEEFAGDREAAQAIADQIGNVSVWYDAPAPTYAEAIEDPREKAWGERFMTRDGITLEWFEDMADGGNAGYAQVDDKPTPEIPGFEGTLDALNSLTNRTTKGA